MTRLFLYLTVQVIDLGNAVFSALKLKLTEVATDYKVL